MKKPTVVIIGAGPAGLGAAWQLCRQDKARVVVLEKQDQVGGNTGSFELAGIPVDFGSHRLHPACDAHILDDLRKLLGDDLLDRPRHGRIRLRGKWIHFPLKPVDLVLRLPWSFGFGVACDSVKKFFSGSDHKQAESFATVLRAGLGRTICEDFYFPYARKIWGLEPEVLSAIQARRRVSAGSLGKMVKKVLSAVPGLKPPGSGRFYYLRKGFGQISESIAQAAQDEGAALRMGASVTNIDMGNPHKVHVRINDNDEIIEADYVWSTIPLAILSKVVSPKPDQAVYQAADSLPSRAMVLVYLVLEQSQFTPFDAHYFPEAHIKLTRLSEPKNYSARSEPADCTVLCGEVPCQVGDDVWNATDDQLGDLMRDALLQSGLPVRCQVRQVVSCRLPHAYPVYLTGYEKHFQTLDDWSSTLDHILTFGRQGLFAHDNTHHALAMAYAAVDCLSADGTFDQAGWASYREAFKSHVVED